MVKNVSFKLLRCNFLEFIWNKSRLRIKVNNGGGFWVPTFYILSRCTIKTNNYKKKGCKGEGALDTFERTTLLRGNSWHGTRRIMQVTGYTVFSLLFRNRFWKCMEIHEFSGLTWVLNIHIS